MYSGVTVTPETYKPNTLVRAKFIEHYILHCHHLTPWSIIHHSSSHTTQTVVAFSWTCFSCIVHLKKLWWPWGWRLQTARRKMWAGQRSEKISWSPLQWVSIQSLPDESTCKVISVLFWLLLLSLSLKGEFWTTFWDSQLWTHNTSNL